MGYYQNGRAAPFKGAEQGSSTIGRDLAADPLQMQR